MRVKYMQDASQQNITREETTEKTKVENKIESLVGEESDSSEISEELSAKELEERREKIVKREQRKSPSHEETQKKDTSDSELATVTRSASSTTSDNSISVMSISGDAANETKRQTEVDELRAGILTTDDQDERRGSGHVSVAVGEWNSLPVLVERLREALELSLVTGCRRGDEPTVTSSLAESNGAEVNDRLHAYHSMGQAVIGGYDHDNLESKKDELKFLEDLLLSDIQTALSRLRETLEHTDVTTLAKHGGVSDPTSKLHLLRLVSSLLSRLQIPQKETTMAGENRQIEIATAQGGAARKRRFVRHTIGVSAEEIAYARKQLEESSADLARLNKLSVQRQQEPLLVSTCNVPSSAPNSTSSDVPNSERHTEEICDKYTKNAINQRQSLRDKNKDCRGDIGAYRPITVGTSESNMPQDRRWCGSMDDKELAIEKTNEEQSQVTKLAAILRQRAELVSVNRCNINNKFTAKKSKIKRANTVDIPSYLKLQAGSFGCDNSGCVQLRRPINVGDKVASSTTKNVAVPSFHPRTENDKKFLALINKNNEMQTTFNTAPAFKTFGYTKVTDMSSLTNENWNSRFSNIKTAFDKPSSVSDEIKLSPKPCPAKHFSSALHTPCQQTNKKIPIGTGTSNKGLPFVNMNISKSDIGFRHASSSLFRKIEKSQNLISPPSYHCSRFKDNASGNALREKARIMFDRNSNVQSQSPTKFKIDDNESSLKHSFPRPPWIERDRNGMKSSQMIAENGRLDYRLFCKQFAPFIGKNNAAESTKSRNTEEQRKRNEQSIQHEIFLMSDKKLAMIDGKISFETSPEKELRVQASQHHRANESCHEVEEPVRDKIDFLSEKDIFELIRDRQYNEQEMSENIMVDTTLSDSSSIAIQTGEINDNQPEEVRVFPVVPKVLKDLSSVCNDASVQTYNQSEQPLTDYIESEKERMTLRYECNDTNSKLNSNFHLAEDPRSFILGHNWNYHTVATDVASKNESSLDENTRDLIEKQSSVGVPNPIENIPSRNISNYHSPKQHEQIFQTDNSQHENCFSPKLATENQSQIYQNYPLDMKFNRNPLENEILSVSYEIDKTNLSCINDSGLPEEQNIQNQDISADAGVVTRYTCAIATVASTDIPEIRSERMGSEVSLSPSPSHFRPYVRKTSNEATTKEEIRRHNILQQNLVRRLQNERTMLNNQYTPIPKLPNNFNQPSKFQLSDTSLVTSFPSTSSNSEFGAINRVTALREQYEQPGTQLRPIQKERSPIPNNVNGVMDSSDKYLVSCSNKSVRSTVLSKSESWHQLALSSSHHPPPRLSQGGLPPTSSHLPKLPKSKSPSFFRTKKQYEASLSSDNVKRMEDKIRRYFDNSNDSADAKDSKGKHFLSHNMATKGLVGLSRSRTMPGICDEKLHLLIPAVPQISATNLNSADVDKVFDDIFEEATRTDDHRF